MKIAYCSDLHLEVREQNFELPDADLLILAGDICLIYDLADVWAMNKVPAGQRDFFQQVSAKYKNVIWIPGNHEYWECSLTSTALKANQFLLSEHLDNIVFSPCSSMRLNGIKFVFTTLWTDVYEPPALPYSSSYSRHNYMRDYDEVKVESEEENVLPRKLRVADTRKMHADQRAFIMAEIQNEERVVLVTHHAPDLKSYDAARSDGMEYYYCCTDMKEIIEQNSQIEYYIHGHTHNPIKYDIGKTTVISNPRGYYGYESISNDFKVKVLEL